MALRAKFTARARREVERVHVWWRAHRGDAPELVLDEVDAALALLEQTPHVGAPYRGSRVGTRRLLLTQTRFHVYYCVRGEDLVVLSVWSALRGRGPRL